ncbi:MAG TPA: protein kinase [Thermoanaerobaculia bacterium]|jgi:TolB-like protein|nr:protein kinase [Thermoanaerobaculia bacterium]
MAPRVVSHYAIERSIGAGGMGEVFLARDLALGRPVALKLLGGAVGPESLERFRREAEASARVQHPAIATFYEAGEADGVAFLAMEYVTGETLRSRLVRGPLPPAEALALADALLEGLTHAHAAGVLHRDIKPENVMVCEDGGAKLLDFGIARLLDAPVEGGSEDATAAALTEEGSVLGTLGYMSPEQLKAQPLDERSDVFSLAATLYEAVSGKTAFPGRSPGERVAAILSGDGPPLEGAVPADIAPVLGRALARDREARYASAAAFLADLRSAASGEYVAALPDSIAVLDFENLSGNPEDGWIGSGIAESVGADLASLDGLTVVARDVVVKGRGALAAAGKDPEPVAVGHALACRWVLSGAYQRAGPALRVTSRLTEVATRSAVATEKVDGRLDDIFAIQDRLAQSVAERLRLTRGGEARASAPPPPKKLAAYEAHARGRRFFFRLEKGGLDQARQLYEEAISADSGYAPALGDLAAVHAMRYTFTTDRKELALARGYAERAIAADPEAGGPRIWLSYALWRQGLPEEAIAQSRRAAELVSSDPFASYFGAGPLSSLRRWREAIPMFQAAVAADEQHGWSWLGLGWAQLETGRPIEAKWCLERAVSLERLRSRHPTAGVAGYLGDLLRREGDLEGARARCVEALEALEKSDFMYRDSFRGVALCTLGRASLEKGDAGAARAAFGQAASHLRGRPHGLGEGHLLVQALAGLSRADGDAARLDEALALFEERRTHNFDWLWLCTDDVSLLDLSRAARACGREDQARELLDRARAFAGAEATGSETRTSS